MFGAVLALLMDSVVVADVNTLLKLKKIMDGVKSLKGKVYLLHLSINQNK